MNNDNTPPSDSPADPGDAAVTPAPNPQPVPPVPPVVSTPPSAPPTVASAPAIIASEPSIDGPSTSQPVGYDSNVSHLKSLLIKIMLGCLIAAAAVAVMAILAGSMGDVAWKSIGTIISAIIHIGLLFAVISVAANKNPRLQQANNFVINTAVVITILSFFTSIFATWQVITGALPFKLYATYMVALFLVLHAKTLMDVDALYDKVKPYVYANYVFMLLVGMLILGVVYVDNSWSILNGLYGRILGAAAIIDVTLSMVVAVMHRLHLQKHPELREVQGQNSHTGGRIIVAILLFVFLIWPLLSLIVSATRQY